MNQSLPLLAAIGVFFVVATVTLEVVRQRNLRRRGDNDTSIAPKIIRNSAP